MRRDLVAGQYECRHYRNWCKKRCGVLGMVQDVMSMLVLLVNVGSGPSASLHVSNFFVGPLKFLRREEDTTKDTLLARILPRPLPISSIQRHILEISTGQAERCCDNCPTKDGRTK
jgi:hypothetical protein